jgi:hypothetical protein
MPRKERCDSENERARIALEHEQKVDREFKTAMAGAPIHVAGRIGQASRLADALQYPAGYKWKAMQFGPDGQPTVHRNHDAGRHAANATRKGFALDWAQRIFDRYGDLIWTRHGPAKIARAEGVAPRRVQRARERLKANGQA